MIREKAFFCLILFIIAAAAVSLTVSAPVFAEDAVPDEVLTDEVLPSDDEEEDEPLQYTLTVNYIKEDEEAPFRITTHKHEPGFSYNIASPVVEGYKPEVQRLTGTIEEDSEITVKYHVVSYMLTIHFRHLNGRAAATDYIAVEPYGTEYEVPAPSVRGHVAVTPVVSGVIPGRDVEWTIFYVDRAALINY